MNLFLIRRLKIIVIFLCSKLLATCHLVNLYTYYKKNIHFIATYLDYFVLRLLSNLFSSATLFLHSDRICWKKEIRIGQALPIAYLSES